MRLQSWGKQNVAPGPYPAAAAFKNKVLLAGSPPLLCVFSVAVHTTVVEKSHCLGPLKTKMLTIWSFMGLWDRKCKRSSGFQAKLRKNFVRRDPGPGGTLADMACSWWGR